MHCSTISSNFNIQFKKFPSIEFDWSSNQKKTAQKNNSVAKYCCAHAQSVRIYPCVVQLAEADS